MRRILCALTTLSVAVGGAANATATTPVATYDLPGGDTASCLHDAQDGRFGLFGTPGRTTSPMQVLRLDGATLAPESTTELGWMTKCPALAGAPGGGVVMAGAVSIRQGPQQWRAELRAATAGGSPQTLSAPADAGDDSPAVAVNASGAAVATWVESTFPGDAGHPARLLAAVRPAGSATFGRPVVVDPALSQWQSAQPAVGIDASGRATIAWIAALKRGYNQAVAVASTDATGAFSARQTFPCCALSDVALAVDPDGRALLAAISGAPTLYERLPGQDTFTELPQLDSGAGFSPSSVVVALGADGEAVVADASDSGSVAYATRPPGGTFGARRALARGRDESSIGGAFVALTEGPGPFIPVEEQRVGHLSAAVHGDQAAVAWITDSRADQPAAAYAAFGTVTGALGAAQRLGNPCRPANAVRAVVLPDGAPAVAWTDNAWSSSDDLQLLRVGAHGRLTVVRDGSAPSPTAPAPEVHARVLATPPLHLGAPLRIRVSCPADGCALQLHADTLQVPSPQEKPGRTTPLGGSGRDTLVETTSVGPGTHTVMLDPSATIGFVAPRTTARVPVTVTTCAPDSAATRTVTLHPRLRGAPLRPMPRIVSVTAVRRGATVRVVVRTDRPVRGLAYALGRPISPDRLTTARTHGHGRRRLTMTIRDAGRVREVEVALTNLDGYTTRPRVVRVR
jgi:hypothetical protein